MASLKQLIPCLLILSCFCACKKDKADINKCENLKISLRGNNEDNLKLIVGQYIAAMASQEYNEPNLNNLASSISNNCSISAYLVCFDCIFTLPAESELELTFSENGTTFHKIVDLKPTSDNKIKVQSMHE